MFIIVINLLWFKKYFFDMELIGKEIKKEILVFEVGKKCVYNVKSKGR